LEGEWTYFVAGADQVINPETRSSVASIATIEVRPNLGNGDLDIINGVPFPQFVLKMDCRFGCEDARLNEETLTITGGELLAKL